MTAVMAKLLALIPAPVLSCINGVIRLPCEKRPEFEELELLLPLRLPKSLSSLSKWARRRKWAIFNHLPE